MQKYTCVYYETNKLSIVVEAETPEQAIEKADNAVKDDWEGCEEECLGTSGVEQVLDDKFLVVWQDGERDDTEAGDGAQL